MKNKICSTCFNQNIFKSKKIQETIIKYHKSNYPKYKDLKSYKINLGKDFKDRYIYFWAAYGKKDTLKNRRKAYKKGCNSGILKTDKKGGIKIYLRKPKSYKVKNKKFPAHIHFIVEKKNKNGWLKKQFAFKV